MRRKEFQRNFATQSFMKIIFQIETRKSKKQFVLCGVRLKTLGACASKVINLAMEIETLWPGAFSLKRMTCAYLWELYRNESLG